MNALDWICWFFLVVGGLNWGLVGFFNFNLVDVIFGSGSGIARIIYAVVGLCALWFLYSPFKKSS